MTADSSPRQASLLAGLLLFGLAPLVLAQTPIGPRAFEPPSYGEPSAALLAGYEMRDFGELGVSITFAVPTVEVQRLMPAEYSPVTLADPSLVSITCFVVFDAQLVLRSPVGGFDAGTYGPYNYADFFLIVNGPSGIEGLHLANLISNTEVVDIRNALLGSNSSRLGDINGIIREEAGERQTKILVQDLDFGLRIRATITGPSEIQAQSRQLGPYVNRFLNTSVSPPSINVSTWSIGSTDSTALDVSDIELNAARLRFAGGRLAGQVLGGALFWPGESFYKLR